MAEEVVIYGSNWCPHTKRALHDLKTFGVDFRYVDIDADSDAEQKVAGWNNGRAVRPTIDIGGDIFVNPSTSTLESELNVRGLLP